MGRGEIVFQEVIAMAKILTFIENHWEDPQNRGRPAYPGETFEMLGRLTDEYGNPMAKRSVALHIRTPSGAESDIHNIICNDNGVMRKPVVMAEIGVYEAFYWFGGDDQYEGC